MKKENIDILMQIYSALGMVSTRGEDTLTMADCLRALREVILAENEGVEEASTAE